MILCALFSPATGNESAPADIPFGGVDCDHDTGPSLLIEPRAHLRAVLGDTDLEDAGLAHGGHDPVHSGFSVPSLSLGADILYGEHIAGFTEGIISWNDVDGWDAELEEFYARFLNLPGGFEMKAGRLLATVGTQNNIHNHAWKFVDANLGNVRFLGDDGLVIEGVEITWMAPSHWNDRLTLSFGNAVSHDHEEAEHAGGAHDHSEEAGQALWDRNVLSVHYQAIVWPSDTCQFIYGASYLQGENFMAKTGRLFGVDLTYTWLQDEDHGKQFTWRNEAMLRRIGTDEGKFEELAVTSAALYKLNPKWEIGLRYDYLEGVDDPELPERHRVSPSLACYFSLGKIESVARLQYNFDHSDERGGDHSVWLQFGFEWGAGGDAHVH
ncbi:MAG: hypothetical protein H7A51_11880 [Akkermansiaceae bacterium]|nr:hypothetical protein [Akkermansiaceae bacterium]